MQRLRETLQSNRLTLTTKVVSSGMAIVFAMLLNGCGGLSVSISRIEPKGVPDFLRSEILVNGYGLADGVSGLLVVVRLLNSDGSPVPGHFPQYQVAAGLSLASNSTCSVSDNNGIAICLLRATLPGTRTIRMSNLGKAHVEAGVTFTPPAPRRSVGNFVASSTHATTSQGHTIQATVGGYHTGIRFRSSEGYTVYSSVQGALSQ